jgi:hypothetical protein
MAPGSPRTLSPASIPGAPIRRVPRTVPGTGLESANPCGSHRRVRIPHGRSAPKYPKQHGTLTPGAPISCRHEGRGRDRHPNPKLRSFSRFWRLGAYEAVKLRSRGCPPPLRTTAGLRSLNALIPACLPARRRRARALRTPYKTPGSGDCDPSPLISGRSPLQGPTHRPAWLIPLGCPGESRRPREL